MGFKEIPAAENALATIGAVLWSVQIIPQLWLSYRSKSTKGLSENLMLIWYLATLFLGAYLVAQRLSIPLQIQPQLFGFFSACSYTQCLYYGRGWSRWKAGLALFLLSAFFAGFEAGSVYALWAGQGRGVEWPLQMYGYISAALLALGLAPQYWEIYKLRQVIGISLFFMAVDIMGGVFSFLSLFFRADLDIAAFVSYACVVVLDSIVVLLAFILNPIAKRKGYWIGDERQDVESSNPAQRHAETSTSPVASIAARTRSRSFGRHVSRVDDGAEGLPCFDTQTNVVGEEGTNPEGGEGEKGLAFRGGESTEAEAEGHGMGAHAAGGQALELEVGRLRDRLRGS